MRKLLLAAMLFAAVPIFGADISVGIVIGRPPAPRVLAVRPPPPGVGFYWVDGYWYPVGRRYKWHSGYWTRAPYADARWVAPRWADGRYFAGYWDGPRGHFDHDHRWDHDRDRDYHDHGRGHGRDRDDRH